MLYFFTQSTKLSKKWSVLSHGQIESKLFVGSLILRFIWVFFSYIFYEVMTGSPFEFAAADSKGYHFEAIWMVDVLKDGFNDFFWGYYEGRWSDMGYPVYLAGIYSFFGDSVLVPRLFKVLLGALTVVLIYRLAKRNFGEKVGKISGVLALLFPNLIYYTGLHTKETEMVFLTVLFFERADALLRSNMVKYGQLFLVLILCASLYLFRAVLAYSAFISFLLVLILSKSHLIRIKRQMSLIIGLILFVAFISGSALIDEAFQYWEARVSNQQVSLQHRSSTNQLAEYGSSLVFAPLVLAAPFPTFVNIENQQNHMLMSGAYYVKNIMAFFVLIGLLHLLKTQQWKEHVLIISFLLGYLAILAMSKFALVERFHMPGLPFHIILAAYGISMVSRKEVKLFNWYLILILVVIVAWNWFKLAGRGLI